ncbi:unnamed protein product [Camellia sinensis]
MAVIRSPECPRWGHSLSWGRLTDSTTVYCSEAILDALGRDFTHNHFFCDVDIRFPLRRLQKEATLGIVAIFDGHYSNEASETAWKYIEEYFFLHTYFLFDRLEGDNFDGSYVKMLKEALVRAIHDIKNRYTATIIVMVDDHLFLSSLDGSAEVATGSCSRWMAASQSQSQSVCEVSSRRYLLPLIANGVRGVTSNPAIFQKAISTSNAYNEQFRELVQAGKDIESAYWELVVKDIQDACKLFEAIYDQTDGGDGYVSVEVSPRLADDTVGTVEAAKWLHKLVDRRNVYIKIPATAECIPSIKEVISCGISVNVTLIFSLARYEAVIDAYLDGLEASGLSDLSKVTSVASFFVSRVDTLVDKMLEKIGTPEALDLRGKAANAQAALAYQLYQKKFSGPRWEALVKKGAKKQRLLLDDWIYVSSEVYGELNVQNEVNVHFIRPDIRSGKK